MNVRKSIEKAFREAEEGMQASVKVESVTNRLQESNGTDVAEADAIEIKIAPSNYDK